MRVDGSLGGRLRTKALVWIDALQYGVVLAAAVTAGAVLVGVASGGGLVRAKLLLFLAGFLLMGYATVRLWPSSPEDLESGRTGRRDPTGDSLPATTDRTRFQALVQWLPPLRWLPSPPPAERMVPPGKLFLGSLLVLLTSYLMEAALGIR